MNTELIRLHNGKNVYVVSDFHLGIDATDTSAYRERKVVEWLTYVQADAQAIIFLGDVFDFWFEYTHVVPKGFLRLLGKLAEVSDRGIKLYFFKGNHDLWMFDYFEKELGATVSRAPVVFRIGQHSYFMAHGDGLGPGDYTHKFILFFFESKLFQAMFRWLSPELTYRLAQYWSRKSRANHSTADSKFLGDDEWLWAYCKSIHPTVQADFYVFGHRHLPLDLPVGEHARYINTGEWLTGNRYLRITATSLEILAFASSPEQIAAY